MAKIIENKRGRRLIRLSTDDVISVVREYQNTVVKAGSYSEIRQKLDSAEMYLPEDVY